MKLDVRGQVFKIDLVSNFVRREYSLMAEISSEIQQLSIEISELVKQLQDVKTREELDERTKDAQRLKEEIQEKTKVITEIRDDLVKELLRSNGHKYDGDFWDRQTSPEDINDFLLACLKKDYEPGKDSSVKKK